MKINGVLEHCIRKIAIGERLCKDSSEKEVDFEWHEECEKAFGQLKRALMREPVLA